MKIGSKREKVYTFSMLAKTTIPTVPTIFVMQFGVFQFIAILQFCVLQNIKLKYLLIKDNLVISKLYFEQTAHDNLKYYIWF